jgi:hypothetical protein
MQLPQKINTSLETIEDKIENVPTRPFDKYVLGPFLIWYGLKSRSVGKLPRKLLVMAGLYQVFYNWKTYRELPQKAGEVFKNGKAITK